jgi:hypothetical protein
MTGACVTRTPALIFRKTDAVPQTTMQSTKARRFARGRTAKENIMYVRPGPVPDRRPQAQVALLRLRRRRWQRARREREPTDDRRERERLQLLH